MYQNISTEVMTLVIIACSYICVLKKCAEYSALLRLNYEQRARDSSVVESPSIAPKNTAIGSSPFAY